MQIEKTAPGPIQEMLQPLTSGELHFGCHAGLSCFTECCRLLNLLLTPYDVMRLKNNLGMSADEFMDRYTELGFEEQRDLPGVYLKMLDDERKACPFVSPEGCTVYNDRPSACRTYPLARATRKHQYHGTLLENYFVVREDHCKGFEEKRRWNVVEWVADQGLGPYHEMNDLWMEIITHRKLTGSLSEKQMQMFFMASHNLEQFRRFVFGGRFFQLFKIAPEEAARMEKDDEALLRLAFRWLRFSLFDEPSLERWE